MREIVDGKLDAEVAVTGNDEITEMARTLSVFRDGLAEVEKANAKVAADSEEATRARSQAMMAIASDCGAGGMGVRETVDAAAGRGQTVQGGLWGSDQGK